MLDVFGDDFGRTVIERLNNKISIAKKKKLEKVFLENQLSNGDLNDLKDKQEINELFSTSIWSTRKVELFNLMVENGTLEENGLSKTDSPYHSGFYGIRKSNLVWKFTQDEIEEFKKCYNDINYFADNYVYLKDEFGQYNNVKIRDYQIDILNKMVNNRFNIINASRQSGKTVSSAIFIIWYSIFHQHKTIMILANKERTVQEIIDKCKNIYEMLPMWLKPGVTVWNIGSIKFENKTRILTQSCSKSVAIGFSIDVLYCDEFAHIPANFIESFWRSVFPTISSMKNSKIIITSTPNGLNLFWQIWNSAIKNENDFVPTKILWKQIPGTDENWKTTMINNLGSQKLFDQEFGLQFIVDENSLLDTHIREKLDKDAVLFKNKNMPGLVDIDMEKFYFWKSSFDLGDLKKKTFILCFDFAEGIGEDYNVVSIFELKKCSDEQLLKNRTSKEINIKKYIQFDLVGYFENNTMNIFDFNSCISKDILNLFNLEKIKIVMEANDNRYIGIVKDLFSIAEKNNKKMNEYIFLKSCHTEKSKKKKIGYKINKQSKSNLLRELVDDIDNDVIILNSFRHIEQLKYFSLDSNGGSIYKSMGTNDDCAMSCLGIPMAIEYAQTFIVSFLFENNVDIFENKEKDETIEMIGKYF